ncbi:MAG: heavy metal translocating P-type ATPase [Bacteroidetes bacterium]|nr:heavy metal translocating P-type ATPase [Bacteroidota bacterium]MBU1484911.1 heavy metal translocating P-type ATPase [Bacteroidota bacterium]MBU1761246.1 heavy metal translocating P-type ATPase [Bacteroidota bacterium]MBU2266489.1 heavy metal translocating P-type ATPase [Bacteroidota bacterium]MBU2374936.1 heavy metal translocating P-type ATPase [Bacteroidota bacterium]
MKHTYKISGMTCNGCRTNAEKALNTIKGIHATVTLNPPEADIEMEEHIPTEKLQQALSATTHYTIVPIEVKKGCGCGCGTPTHKEKPDSKKESSCCSGDTKTNAEQKHQDHQTNSIVKNGNGVFYCPMHCEGTKTYDKAGDCPVCGMDLVEEVSLKKATQYTCPMHPEIVRDEPGACPICGMDLVPMEATDDEEDKTYLKLLRKFKIAAAFTIPIFLIAMSEMIPNNLIYKLMDLKYWNWVQLVLSIPVVFYATWMFFERAWRSVMTWNLNMFTLIGIGSGVAWLFSVVALLFPDVFPDQFKTESGTVFVYFEAATVILTLVLMGQLLEARAHGKTNNAIKELLKLAPNKATKIVEGEDKVVSIDSIHPGDLLRVKPGEKIPVDGSIHEGEAVIDESMISGEPIPVQKKKNDKVSSGTINGNKSFVMVTEKVGSETLLSQIIEMVNNASRSKAPIQKMADQISGYFVPIVVFISVITFIIWAIFGPEPSYVYAFVNAIAVLIIACPCALGLATPMSVMVGVGKGAHSGVLIKNAESLEKMDEMDVLVIDKTGTVTEGKPSVEKVESVETDFSENDIIEKIIALNSSSEHPLAQATLKYGKEKNIKVLPISKFEAITGKGVIGELNGKKLALGNDKLMTDVKANISKEMNEKVTTVQKQGKTVSYLAVENKVVGFVVIADKIKASSKEAIHRLQKEGLQVVMFTGDNEDTAKAVSDTLNLDGYKAQMLPQDKLEEIKKLQASGKKVVMAGDGINDAPALSQANIGIAMGTGTDVAIESAGITLIKGDLNGIAKAKQLSHKVMRNIKENLFFALGYNVIGIPIAAGVLYPFFGMLLSPMIAALAMSFSSVSVIMNALRLKNANID